MEISMSGLWFKILFVVLLSSSAIKFSCCTDTDPLIDEDKYLLFDGVPAEPPTFKYGSLHTLDRLMEISIKEETIVEVLTGRLKLLQAESKLITSYLEDYDESTKKAVEGLHDSTNNTPEGRGRIIGSSAVLAHRMTDRYTSIINKYQTLISSNPYIQIQRDIDKVLQPNILQLLKDREESITYNVNSALLSNETEKLPIWPNLMDKYISDVGFVHLHEIYGAYPAEMRIGSKVDTKYGSSLNAKQCTSIGLHALSRNYYYMAIEWLELAKNLLLSNYIEDRSVPVDFVSSLIDIAITEHNLGKEFNSSEEFYTDPTYEGEPAEERIRGRKFIYNSPSLRQDRELNAMSEYWALCSGITFQTPATQIPLKCFYETKSHAYLYINPLKTEVLSENPPLLQFYDVLSNDTIEKIKAITAPRLELSGLVGIDDDDLDEITRHRTSAGTFMQYLEMPKLYHHSEIISGLKLLDKASEMAQVVEYTYGRYYIYHTDLLEEDGDEEEREYVKKSGDRAATLLYYLETATFGGDTPFCSAGVNARPVRGSAILWYNLYRNGSVRQNVYHGACPIIHGHKIIINHWIRYNGNWNNYKCTLNQFE